MIVGLRYPRLLDVPAQSFFLFGPRGVGKSTWVSQKLSDAHRIDLLDEGLYQGYLARPETFADELRSVATNSFVIVDEIQRLPNLLNEVHRAIEDRGLRFALCGSSARKLKAEGVNLLAGRALKRTMHPFIPQELGDSFNLESALRFGTLPVVWDSSARNDTLRAYVQMYLKEEIQTEALVRNLPGFARFLPIAALFHAQVLSTAGLARDAGVARTTVGGYLEILEDTLMAFRLPAYQARLRVREKKHPKLYWVDAGLVRAIKGRLGQVGIEERGALFEGWIAGLLRAYRDYRDLFNNFYYWAPVGAASVEVDFLLERDGRYIAIEAKSTESLSKTDLRGLQAVAELPKMERRIVVFQGKRRRLTPEGIEIWPVAAFLAALADGTLWP